MVGEPDTARWQVDQVAFHRDNPEWQSRLRALLRLKSTTWMRKLLSTLAARRSHRNSARGLRTWLCIQEMDEAGIDVQVLSHVSPGTQRLDPETAVRLARAANQRLHEAAASTPPQPHPPRCRHPIRVVPPTNSNGR